MTECQYVKSKSADS